MVTLRIDGRMDSTPNGVRIQTVNTKTVALHTFGAVPTWSRMFSGDNLSAFQAAAEGGQRRHLPSYHLQVSPLGAQRMEVLIKTFHGCELSSLSASPPSGGFKPAKVCWD